MDLVGPCLAAPMSWPHMDDRLFYDCTVFIGTRPITG
jgi:hypothetical protein